MADAGSLQGVVAPGRLAAFWSGLRTNLLNPKAGVFYMSLLPQFIPQGAPAFGTAMLLTLIDITELLIWFCILSTAASALSLRISRASCRQRSRGRFLRDLSRDHRGGPLG
jgi:threonine/homoserine/homoserine lactone efflux protein